MNHKLATPYGSWRSSITPQMVAAGVNPQTEVYTSDGRIYWLERRAEQGGRTTIIEYFEGEIRDLLDSAYSCRNRVHEYGGGAYTVTDDAIFFVNDDDQQIYQLHPDGQATRITEHTDRRYADLIYSNKRLFAIEEIHTENGGEPVNRLVCIHLDSRNLVTLCEQFDFYANPTISNDGKHIAWLSWNHPDMPWDNTCLYTAELDDAGQIFQRQLIAGGDGVSIFQPRWSPDDMLYYVADDNGWWNLHRYRQQQQENVLPMKAEFGLPQWVFAQSTYCFGKDNTLIACCNKDCRHSLIKLDTVTLKYAIIVTDLHHFGYLTAEGESLACLAASATQPSSVYKMNLAHLQLTPALNHVPQVDPAQVSLAKQLTIRTKHDDDIYANYYPPHNPECISSTSLPPLIVLSHGGPTGQSDTSFDINKQFWTNRGFAILDVNYSGSTGYGRQYRERLKTNWGIRDVSDVCDAALYMVEQGLADPQKLIIKGSSAGGYTVLAALTFEEVFHAGASYYGISNLESLATDTHKFESRYLDSLIGDYPQQQSLYYERSPINYVDKLNCPVIFLQGDEDKVVPKAQAESMLAALDAKNIPVTYLLFRGEQHGFRQAQTIIDALEAELCFYQKIFGLGSDEDCELEIKNFAVS